MRIKQAEQRWELKRKRHLPQSSQGYRTSCSERMNICLKTFGGKEKMDTNLFLLFSAKPLHKLSITILKTPYFISYIIHLWLHYKEEKFYGVERIWRINLEHVFIAGKYRLTAIHTHWFLLTEDDTMVIPPVLTLILALLFGNVVTTKFSFPSFTKNGKIIFLISLSAKQFLQLVSCN